MDEENLDEDDGLENPTSSIIINGSSSINIIHDHHHFEMNPILKEDENSFKQIDITNNKDKDNKDSKGANVVSDIKNVINVNESVLSKDYERVSKVEEYQSTPLSQTYKANKNNKDSNNNIRNIPVEEKKIINENNTENNYSKFKKERKKVLLNKNLPVNKIKLNVREVGKEWDM